MKRRAALALLAAASVGVCGCFREKRQYRESPAATRRTVGVRLSPLEPGGVLPDAEAPEPFGGNAQAISDGKRLFDAYNCSGCHAHGGGGIGPPLMDPYWIYGGRPGNIYATIVEGRPNGMPSFGGKISNQQLWELVAYVRSLSGSEPKAATSARNDEMNPLRKSVPPAEKPK